VGATKSAVDVGLEFEFEYHAMLKPPVEIGPCPYGTRRFYEAVGGEVTGERISGRVLSGGGDWILIGPDGWGRLDVRAQIQTADNALIFMSYFGVLERNDAVRRATETGGGTDYENTTFAPRLGSRPATLATPGSIKHCSSLKAGSTPAVTCSTESFA